MKIKPEHYAHIKAALSEARDTFPDYAEFVRRGLTRTRWEFDLAHAAGLTPYFCAVIYPYANDDHIQTALSRALKEIHP